MTEPPELPPTEPDLPLPLLRTWLARSDDPIAQTDASGRVVWANPAFERVTGLNAGSSMLDLAPAQPPTAEARALLCAALAGTPAPQDAIRLRGAAGAALWAVVRVLHDGPTWLWTLRDRTAHCALQAREQRLSQFLDMAQEYGRLGVWERDIATGQGRWDRHVFGFWDLDPASPVPSLAELESRMHPDDRSAIQFDSTRRTGRYSHRYRVLRPDGGLRWIHSQWEVQAGPDGRPVRALGVMLDDTEVYQTAQRLDSTAAQLSMITELGKVVVWRHDLKTGRMHYDPRGSAVLQIPYRAEGWPIDETRAGIHPDDRKAIEASAAEALRTGLPNDVEARFRPGDGRWRHILIRRAVQRDAGGQPIAFVGVTLDISEQVEQALQSKQLTYLLESAARAASLGIWSMSGDDRQTTWNAQMYELFDLVGATEPPSLSHWLEHCIHTDDAARVGKAAREFLRHGGAAFEIEFRTCRRGGGTRQIVIRAATQRDKLDRTQRVGIAIDVTEQRDALAALHRASERAALIAGHAGIGTWETDPHGENAVWDEQMFRLRGLEPGPRALDPEARLALVHPDDQAATREINAALNGAQEVLAYEFRVRLPDGIDRWLASRSTVLRGDQGEVLCRVGVNWDITAAKSAQHAQQRAELAAKESRAKSLFLSRMSHELRTPLNAVLGFTQLLQDQARARAQTDQLDKLEHVRAAGEQLLALIGDTLDLSALESGTLKLDLQAVALGDAVEAAVASLADLAARHRVVVRSARLDGVVRADARRLQRVVFNLVSNAVRFNRPGGEVLVESGLEGTRVRLRISDTGHGMPPEQLARLFEPFTRYGVDGDGADGGIGGVATGIGLTMVKALIEAMGGQITARSRPATGTVVEIVLPASASVTADSPRPAAAAAGAASTTSAVHRSGQLLYIEDNPVNVLLVEELVKGLAGLRIESEETGAAGVARAASLRPDLILVDMQLPDFDGFEVLRRLRAGPETAAIRCIALSANAMPEDIARGLAGGFDDYWTKPIQFKPFLEALERLFPAAPR